MQRNHRSSLGGGGDQGRKPPSGSSGRGDDNRPGSNSSNRDLPSSSSGGGGGAYRKPGFPSNQQSQIRMGPPPQRGPPSGGGSSERGGGFDSRFDYGGPGPRSGYRVGPPPGGRRDYPPPMPMRYPPPPIYRGPPPSMMMDSRPDDRRQAPIDSRLDDRRQGPPPSLDSRLDDRRQGPSIDSRLDSRLDDRRQPPSLDSRLDSRLDGGPRDDRRYPPHPRDYQRPVGGGAGGVGGEFYQSRPSSRNDHYFGGPPRMRSPQFMGNPYNRNDGYNGARSAPVGDSRAPPPVPFSRPSIPAPGRPGPDYPINRFPPSGRDYHHGPPLPRSSNNARMDGPGGRYDSYSRPSIMDSYRSGPSSSHHSSPSLMSTMGGSKRMRSPNRYSSMQSSGSSNPRSLINSSRHPSNQSNKRADGVRGDEPTSLISAKRASDADKKPPEVRADAMDQDQPEESAEEGAIEENQEGEEDDDDKSDSDASSFEREEVEMEIERVDNAIAKQERILATARTKIAAAERIAREKAAGIESQEKVRQRLLPDSIMEEYRARHLEHITEAPASTAQLIGDIYAANRKLNRVFQEKSKERDMILFNIGNLDLTCGDDVKEALKKLEPTPPVTPILQQFNLHFNPSVRPLLVNHIRRKMFEVQTEKEILIEEYREYEEEWNAKVEKMEAEMEKNGVGLPVKPLISQQSVSNIAGTGLISGGSASVAPVIPQPEESAQSFTSANTSTRTSRRTGFRSDVVRSEAEWQNALSFLGILPEESGNSSNKPFSSDKLAKEVEMVTDPDLIRQMKFMDYNNLVHDPEKELQDYNNLMEIKWSEYDKSIFKSKLMQYGKDFYKIASFLDQKTTQDCITYYYREKVNLRFKNLLRRSQNGRGKRKKDKNEADIAPPSFKSILLMDDEELVPPPFEYSESEKSEHEDDDQTAPIGGRGRPYINDPFSAPVSPLGSPALIDQQNVNWTEEEMQRALRGFELFGRDFHSVASMIGTKTPYQCKAFFNNHRRHVKDEKEAEKKGKESGQGGKKKGKGGRKRTESLSAIPIGNTLGVDGLEDYVGDSGATNEKKRKSNEAGGEGHVKKSKKSDDSVTATTTTAGGGEGSESQPRKTISYWSVSERADFMRLLPIHGKNFEAIAQDIQTKSAIQVRNYFHNSRKKLNLDTILESNGHGGGRARSESSQGIVRESASPALATQQAGAERTEVYEPYHPAPGHYPLDAHPSHPSSYGASYIPQGGLPSAYSDQQSSASSAHNIPYFPPPAAHHSPKSTKGVIIPSVENLVDHSLSPAFIQPPVQYQEEEEGLVGYTPAPAPPTSEPMLLSSYKPSGPVVPIVVADEDSSVGVVVVDQEEMIVDEPLIPVDEPVVIRKNSVAGLINPPEPAELIIDATESAEAPAPGDVEITE